MLGTLAIDQFSNLAMDFDIGFIIAFCACGGFAALSFFLNHQ